MGGCPRHESMEELERHGCCWSKLFEFYKETWQVISTVNNPFLIWNTELGLVEIPIQRDRDFLISSHHLKGTCVFVYSFLTHPIFHLQSYGSLFGTVWQNQIVCFSDYPTSAMGVVFYLFWSFKTFWWILILSAGFSNTVWKVKQTVLKVWFRARKTKAHSIGCDWSKPTPLVSGRGCPKTGLAVQRAHIKGIFCNSKKRECKNFTNANYN